MKEVNEKYTGQKVKEWLEEEDNKKKVKSGLAALGAHTIFISLLNVIAYIIVAPFYFMFGGNDE